MNYTADPNNRNSKGEWQPRSVVVAPIYIWPPNLIEILKYFFGIPGFLFPWNILFILISIFTWLFLTPNLDNMKYFESGWIMQVYFRNFALLVMVAGPLHFYFYIKKSQGIQYKYNHNWMGKSHRYLFSDQNRENVFWSILSGCSIWTIFEVITYWLFANHYVSYLSWIDNPIYFGIFFFIIIFLREGHFFFIHRLLHWKPLYKAAHYLHHKNVNIGPWSGLSMHPIEHILYFSGVIFHWIILSHPIHAIFHLQHAVFAAIVGDTEFEKFVFKKKIIPGPGDYAHYLHHRYFECNYAGISVPFDKWFGSLHNGSDEANEVIRKRRKAMSN